MKKLESESAESESGTEIADSRLLIIDEKPADSRSRTQIAITDLKIAILLMALASAVASVAASLTASVLLNDLKIQLSLFLRNCLF